MLFVKRNDIGHSVHGRFQHEFIRWNVQLRPVSKIDGDAVLMLLYCVV